MNRLSAHIGYLYADLPLEDRPAAAARDGFTAIEHPEPWAIPAADMRALMADFGLTFTQITSGMGDPAQGEKGLAALPGREADFRRGFDRAAEYASVVGAGFVHPMAGLAPADDPAARKVYAANLDWAAARLAGTGPPLLVEAITIPGYHLATLAYASEVQDRLGAAQLFDTYHAATLGAEPAAWIAANAARIGHVHIADHPGRHEPGTGALDFPRILAALQNAGYAGAIGFEYIPSVATSASAAFLPVWKALLSQRITA
ncbi:MAG TPA: TIM barrel protein [Albidovulum sp.]|uniref:hydroxypyruvate isomerase family protein n=1 Tax=Albidovulum sp. TaxID=1872424 RepID=UPI002D1CD1D7|nr:TIM barrel protein [Albidovulum sp.]